jgi:hypothetical protein
MFVPPPPGYHAPAQEREAEAPAQSGGWGFGSFVKAGLAVAGIYGIAHVLSQAAAVTHEVREFAAQQKGDGLTEEEIELARMMEEEDVTRGL